jgi:CHAT domain
MPVDIGSTTIEFHRFGGAPGVLLKDAKYIRTCGYQKAADEVVVRIEPRELRRSLNRLRYGFTRTTKSEADAQQLLGAEADNFLPESQIFADGRTALHQVDIVTHASELRAYPFEAIYANESRAYLESPDKGMILTRRIRSEFSYTVPPWPEVPSVLFVHAQVDHDLSQELIDEHRLALSEALAPWGNPQDLEKRNLLVVREIDSVEALALARKLASFSYIHILAHGARMAEEDMEEHETEWGLRLGRVDTDAVSPKAIADALKPINEHPLVVTLAACDSGTAERPELGNSSLVETLHRNGIPVVVASQFPLTKPGSITLTKEFYRPLLSGADVRIALHAARVALREEARQVDERRHDWLSLVGYVRLPAEGYSQYLRAFGLRVQLHMLEAARKDAESLFAEIPPPRETFDRVESRLHKRIMQLQSRKEELSGNQDRELEAECAGLLASGSKSLAELRFVQARQFPEEKGRFDSLSRATLEDSLKWYSETYRRDLSRHWHGIQKLALEVALTGRISDPTELMFIRRVAQNACDENQNEYWACGTLAEAILLGALTPEGLDLTSARAALNLLRERSARNANDNGFAVKSARRQFERYVTWWTKGNGYFPERESDISAHAQALVGCLPV